MRQEHRESTLETIGRKRDKAEKKRRYYSDREKILKHQESQLTRKARTNRLCTRAGMLESFLQRPSDLSNDQVMELLQIAFRQEPVQEALKQMLQKAERDEKPDDEGTL